MLDYNGNCIAFDIIKSTIVISGNNFGLGEGWSFKELVEDRIYRRAMLKQAAITEILNNAGTQFDPNIAKIFVDILNNGELNEEV